MKISLPIPFLTLFSLIFFMGCTTKNQPIACFKDAPACYTQQNITTHEAVETTICDRETACSNCFAVIL